MVLRFLGQADREDLTALYSRSTFSLQCYSWSENAYSETFNSHFGDELLKTKVFTNLFEAKVLVEDYRKEYNRERPHSALGYQTPEEFAASCELVAMNTDPAKELESTIVLS